MVLKSVVFTIFYSCLRIVRALSGLLAISEGLRLELIGAFVFGVAFFALRNLINWAHTRQTGAPHPALIKELNL
jgi:hypothetical protein